MAPISDYEVARLDMLRPPDVRAVRFKVQTADKGGTWAQCITYVDARYVAGRLDHAAPGNWQSSLRAILDGGRLTGMCCRLEVFGIAREDVGVGQGDESIKLKAMASDALKRVAVLHGVGQILYASPRVFLKGPHIDVKDGKVKGISDAGTLEMRRRYESFIKADRVVQLFGQPVDLGDELGSQGDADIDVPL